MGGMLGRTSDLGHLMDTELFLGSIGDKYEKTFYDGIVMELSSIGWLSILYFGVSLAYLSGELKVLSGRLYLAALTLV